MGSPRTSASAPLRAARRGPARPAWQAAALLVLGLIVGLVAPPARAGEPFGAGALVAGARGCFAPPDDDLAPQRPGSKSPPATAPPRAASEGSDARGSAPPDRGGAAAPEGDPSPTPAPRSADAARETELFGDRLAALRAETDALKERVFRSKARLSLLRDTVLQGVLAGSRIVLAHRNRMGAQFRLVKISVVLDGAQIDVRADESGLLDAQDELVLYDGSIPPGAHTVTLELSYRGQGFGKFAYLNDYTFESRSSHTFTAPANGALKVLSVGYEKGNLTTELRNRPAIDWQSVALDAAGKPLPRARVAEPGGAADAGAGGRARGRGR